MLKNEINILKSWKQILKQRLTQGTSKTTLTNLPNIETLSIKDTIRLSRKSYAQMVASSFAKTGMKKT